MKIEKKIDLSSNRMYLKEVFSHFWPMERMFIQNRQNICEIFQKLSANSKVFLVTLLQCYIAFSTYGCRFPPVVIVWLSQLSIAGVGAGAEFGNTALYCIQ